MRVANDHDGALIGMRKKAIRSAIRRRHRVGNNSTPNERRRAWCLIAEPRTCLTAR
jgi:hypothetical protein